MAAENCKGVSTLSLEEILEKFWKPEHLMYATTIYNFKKLGSFRDYKWTANICHFLGVQILGTLTDNWDHLYKVGNFRNIGLKKRISWRTSFIWQSPKIKVICCYTTPEKRKDTCIRLSQSCVRWTKSSHIFPPFACGSDLLTISSKPCTRCSQQELWTSGLNDGCYQ